MRLDLSDDSAAFVGEIQAFIQRHWRDHLEAPHRRSGQRFIAALVDRGWSVPGWPVHEGGMSWTTLQRYLFERELALARAPLMDFFAVEVLGSLLLEVGTADQRQLHLPRIRDAGVRWCVHPSLGGAPPLGACEAEEGSTDVIRFDDCVIRVQFDSDAQWLAALAAIGAEPPSLVLIPLATSSTVSGTRQRDQIVFDGLRLPATVILGDRATGRSLLEVALNRAHRLPLARVAKVRSALQIANSTAQQSSLETSTRRSIDKRLAALEIDLLGLDFMEQQHALNGDGAEAETAMIRIKSQQAATEISTLMVEILGYYALPDEDPLRLDNEGPLGGHHVGGHYFGGRQGQRAIDELLGYVAGFEAMIDRDRIATLKL
jgi:alkylation response protein AidB-like acyl-CoA dehydrogenase